MPIVEPTPVDVDYPLWKVGPEAPPYLTPVQTELFRRGTMLAEALDLAHRQDNEDRPLVVVSAGCSIGAEADSLMALHNAARPHQPIKLTGVDINPDPLETARAGRYSFRNTSYVRNHLFKMLNTLEVYGFETGISSDEVEMFPKNARIQVSDYEIDAQPVRQGHEVNFEQGDIRNDLEVDGPIDVGLLNNVLYHLTVDDATAAISSLAKTLGERGILNIGVLDSANKRMKDRSMTYSQWSKAVAHSLEADYGLHSAARDPFDRPVIFVAEDLHREVGGDCQRVGIRGQLSLDDLKTSKGRHHGAVVGTEF